jgi:hypothetical protein
MWSLGSDNVVEDRKGLGLGFGVEGRDNVVEDRKGDRTCPERTRGCCVAHYETMPRLRIRAEAGGVLRLLVVLNPAGGTYLPWKQ